MSDRKYFQPELETMPVEKLKALQFERLRKQVAYVYDNNPFFRKLYDEAGFKPDDLKTWDDLPKIPFLLLGGGAGFGAYVMLKREKQIASGELPAEGEAAEGEGEVKATEPQPKEPINPDSELFIPVVTPIVLFGRRVRRLSRNGQFHYWAGDVVADILG